MLDVFTVTFPMGKFYSFSLKHNKQQISFDAFSTAQIYHITESF